MKINSKAKLLTVGILLTLILSMVLAVVPAFACGDCDDPGTGTPGYWKNHPRAWPVMRIGIGGITYPKHAAIAIMKTPGKGDKTYTMFKALVAAKLNVMIGNTSWCIRGTIRTANNWLKDFPLGSNVRGRSEAWQYSHGERLYLRLDAYNNGLLCAPPRD